MIPEPEQSRYTVLQPGFVVNLVVINRPTNHFTLLQVFQRFLVGLVKFGDREGFLKLFHLSSLQGVLNLIVQGVTHHCYINRSSDISTLQLIL